MPLMRLQHLDRILKHGVAQSNYRRHSNPDQCVDVDGGTPRADGDGIGRPVEGGGWRVEG